MLDFGEGIVFKEILTNPILDIAARFWEDDRYQAFRICYRTMRRIDDLVDDRKSFPGGITERDALRLRRLIYDWLRSFQKGHTSDSTTLELREILDRFQIPDRPWELLCQAMSYDLEHDGFTDYNDFLQYAEGAAVAPASLFLHLCGVTKDMGKFKAPDYDGHSMARDLALFAYLVHIIRDFQKDQLHHLNYFADDLLHEHSLSLSDLRNIAEGGPINPQFRHLIKKYIDHADYYRARARKTIDTLAPKLESRYWLSLEIIYGLYLQIFERIDPELGKFTTEELNPTQDEIQTRIKEILRVSELPTTHS